MNFSKYKTVKIAKNNQTSVNLQFLFQIEITLACKATKESGIKFHAKVTIQLQSILWVNSCLSQLTSIDLTSFLIKL